MKNKIEDLRNHLFETIEALKDEDKPMELARARAIADTAQVIINSAKVEVEFMKVTGSACGTGFLPEADDRDSKPRLLEAGRSQRKTRGSRP